MEEREKGGGGGGGDRGSGILRSPPRGRGFTTKSRTLPASVELWDLTPDLSSRVSLRRPSSHHSLHATISTTSSYTPPPLPPSANAKAVPTPHLVLHPNAYLARRAAAAAPPPLPRGSGRDGRRRAVRASPLRHVQTSPQGSAFLQGWWGGGEGLQAQGIPAAAVRPEPVRQLQHAGVGNVRYEGAPQAMKHARQR